MRFTRQSSLVAPLEAPKMWSCTRNLIPAASARVGRFSSQFLKARKLTIGSMGMSDAYSEAARAQRDHHTVAVMANGSVIARTK